MNWLKEDKTFINVKTDLGLPWTKENLGYVLCILDINLMVTCFTPLNHCLTVFRRNFVNLDANSSVFIFGLSMPKAEL